MTQNEKIDVCPCCNGKGKIIKPPEHRADESYQIIDCERCEGSGRVYILTTTIEKPFKPKNNV